MKLSRRTPPRRGAVAVWVVVSLAVILGVVAIGMDGGRMLDAKQRAQAGADAAALAAGADLYENYRLNKGADPGGTARAAALRVAATNGYANGGADSVVTVNVPPLAGPFAGQADYAEVVVESRLDAGFSRIFARDRLPVVARAVARGRPRRVGLLVLRPTGPNALQTSNSGTLRVANASVVVNSSDPVAYRNTSGDAVTADSFEVTGGYQNAGKGLVGPVHTGVPPTPDPLRTFPQPNPADYPVRSASALSIKGTVTLQPGVYTGGISLGANATVTLLPGVYVINGGGLSFSGNSTLKGDGVMIYNTGGAAAGSIDTTGNTTVDITPPTTGIYAGVSIFQDRSVTVPISISGSSGFRVGGTVYAPAAAVSVTGSGSFTPGGGFIAWQLSVSGNGSMVVDGGTNRPRAPDVRLVD